jgi:uncharacterized metal-binding protein YceD (DUF177 family)
MKNTREFELAWVGLKPGLHNYEYTLGDSFFKEMEAPEEFSDWSVHVKLFFEKHSAFFRLRFEVGGTVTVACDRCADPFSLELWDEFSLIVKLAGEDEEEAGDEEADVVFIPRSETVLNVAEWLYEFSLLSVPLQRLHPDNADGSSGCNPEVLKMLGHMQEEAEAAAPVDTRWAGLNAFKDSTFDEEEGENESREEHN